MITGVHARCDEIVKTLLDYDNRLVSHADKVQGWTERWNGTMKRIDRVQGTVSDMLENHRQLAQRFEDWKAIGNELREHQEAQDQVLRTHATLLHNAGQALRSLKEIIEEIRAAIIKDYEGLETR